MGPSESHQLQNVVIVNRVKHLSTSSARTHEPHRSQETKLVRYGRFAHSDERRDVAHAELAICQRVENPYARRVPQHPERFRQDLNGGALQQGSSSRFGAGDIKVRSVAGVLDGLLKLGCGGWTGHMNI
jgi:hypothetical protein